ncbi:hypothetical protein J6590_020326 [Homalodisca vitripennis]|nr:hypothetical protein J6590_020326 [Homalodisca vitripennis]
MTAAAGSDSGDTPDGVQVYKVTAKSRGYANIPEGWTQWSRDSEGQRRVLTAQQQFSPELRHREQARTVADPLHGLEWTSTLWSLVPTIYRDMCTIVQIEIQVITNNVLGFIYARGTLVSECTNCRGPAHGLEWTSYGWIKIQVITNNVQGFIYARGTLVSECTNCRGPAHGLEWTAHGLEWTLTAWSGRSRLGVDKHTMGSSTQEAPWYLSARTVADPLHGLEWTSTLWSLVPTIYRDMCTIVQIEIQVITNNVQGFIYARGTLVSECTNCRGPAHGLEWTGTLWSLVPTIYRDMCTIVQIKIQVITNNVQGFIYARGTLIKIQVITNNVQGFIYARGTLVSECTNCRGPAHGLEWTSTLWSLVPTIYRDMCTIVQIEIQVITNNVQGFIYARGTLVSECTNCRGPAHGLEWTGTLWSLVPTIYRDMCTIVQIEIQVITNNVQGFIYARGTLVSECTNCRGPAHGLEWTGTLWSLVPTIYRDMCTIVQIEIQVITNNVQGFIYARGTLVSECTNCRGPAHGLEWTSTLWSLVPTIYRDMCTIVQIEIQVITNNVQGFIYARGTLVSECTNCRGPAHGLEWTSTLWSLVPTIYRDMCTIVQIEIQVITNNVQGFIYARGTLVSECTNCRGPAHGLEWTGTLWSLVPTIYRDMCTIVQIEIQVITNNVQGFIYARGTLVSECTNCRGPAHGLEWTGTLWSLVPTIYRDMCTIVQIKIQVITNNVQGFIYARGTLVSDCTNCRGPAHGLEWTSTLWSLVPTIYRDMCTIVPLAAHGGGLGFGMCTIVQIKIQVITNNVQGFIYARGTLVSECTNCRGPASRLGVDKHTMVASPYNLPGHVYYCSDRDTSYNE